MLEDVQLLAETVAQQAKSVDKQKDSIHELATAISLRPTRRETFSLALVLNLITLVVIIVLTFVHVGQTRQSQEQLHILRECTSIGTKEEPHECFERSQKQTAEAVGIINKTIIYSNQCAAEGNKAIEACVQAKFAKGK